VKKFFLPFSILLLIGLKLAHACDACGCAAGGSCLAFFLSFISSLLVYGMDLLLKRTIRQMLLLSLFGILVVIFTAWSCGDAFTRQNALQILAFVPFNLNITEVWK
jgi:hypothetical protein